MPDFIPRIPDEWHQEDTEATKEGKQVHEGFVAGLGDDAELVGTYIMVDNLVVVTLANHGTHGSGTWAIRVMAPRPLMECVASACEAAVCLGLARR